MLVAQVGIFNITLIIVIRSFSKQWELKLK